MHHRKIHNFVLLALGGLLCWQTACRSCAQTHVDIVPYFQGGQPFLNNGLFRVGSHDLSGSRNLVKTNVVVFNGSTAGYATAPGWTSTADPGWTSPFLGQDDFPAGANVIGAGGNTSVGFNVHVDPRLGRNLVYWNGSGPISFGPVPSGEVLELSLGDHTAVFDGGTNSGPGFMIASNSTFHVHTFNRLFGNASHDTNDMPAPGIYLWSGTLDLQTGSRHQVSPPFFVIMANGFAKYEYEPVIIDGEQVAEEGGYGSLVQQVNDWVILNLGESAQIQPALTLSESLPDGRLHLSWSGLSQEPRTYQVEQATNLTGTWHAQGTPIIGVGGLHEIALSKTNANEFYRISSKATPFSSKYGKIVYHSSDASNSAADLWSVRGDGSELTRLTADAADEINPRWSPDQAQLAFNRQVGGSNYVIVVLRFSEFEPPQEQQITPNDLSALKPTWSPDGSQLAFHAVVNGNRDIYLINADGSNLTRLTSDPGSDGDPAWSPIFAVDPDNEESEYVSRIAFNSDRSGSNHIWVMDPDGQNQKDLTPDAEAVDPAWSPEGTRLAFHSRREGGLSQIYVMAANGGNVRRVTQSDQEDYTPAWAPYGFPSSFELVFNRGRGSDSGLNIIRIDGTHERRLGTLKLGGTVPDWR